ncbi:transcriptional regulator [Candidatus Pacearchaeota archaeon]|nr:transcriptional regulator [Candidatus Pacearchaeota archaeon]|tara:strand:- start:878 stop:1264 length:387 start_codon:yes stop_codon:yes gene_type:complete
MYTLPQEIEVWYVIPAIRREMSKCFIREHGITYEKVGKILGISKAAISQYLKNKRAGKIRLHERVQKEICKSCKKIIDGKSDSVKEIQKILIFVRKNKLHCEVCGEPVEKKSNHDDCVQVIAKYEEDE